MEKEVSSDGKRFFEGVVDGDYAFVFQLAKRWGYNLLEVPKALWDRELHDYYGRQRA
ncbi:MAG: hypothetical protein QXT45_03500 [Candidatus Bilamarchaeaceae archaeon]